MYTRMRIFAIDFSTSCKDLTLKNLPMPAMGLSMFGLKLNTCGLHMKPTCAIVPAILRNVTRPKMGRTSASHLKILDEKTPWTLATVTSIFIVRTDVTYDLKAS